MGTACPCRKTHSSFPLTVNSHTFPARGFGPGLQNQTCILSFEASLKFNQKVVGCSHNRLPWLHQRICLARQVGSIACRGHSWARQLMSCLPFRYYESQPSGRSFQLSCSLVSLYTETRTCAFSNHRVLPSSSTEAAIAFLVSEASNLDKFTQFS